MAGRLLEGFDQVELLSVLAGEDGRFLVVLYQLVHGVETPLADAVDALAALHLEVLVLPRRLQRDGEITRLPRETEKHW